MWLYSFLLQSCCLFLVLHNLGVQGTGNQSIDWIHEDFEQFQRGDIVRSFSCGNDSCTVKVVAKPGLPMIFNSSQPTGGDFDLGTPNGKFGGPGIGAGGLKTNRKPLGNVLIISEDGDRTNPDDQSLGGRISFLFSEPMLLYSIGFLDNDEGFWVRAWDANDQLLYRRYFPPLGDNAFQNAQIQVGGATKMVIDLNGSGAVTEIKYARLPTVDLKHKTELIKDDSYRWGTGGSSVSIDGNTIVAGVYVYFWNGTDWTMQALLDELGDSCRCFGTDNAVSGNNVIVGKDVYSRNGSTWTYQTRLVSAATDTAIFGNTLVIGPEVYRWNGAQWELEETLGLTGENDSVGQVAIYGDTVVVAGLTGLHVFVYDGSQWSKQALISVKGYQQGRRRFFDVERDTIAVSTTMHDNATDPDWMNAYVYIFERQGTTWSKRATLHDDSMGEYGNNYTYVTLALSQETVAIGISWQIPAAWRWMYGSGSTNNIYFFRRYFGSKWVSLPCNKPSFGDDFIDVDISGSRLVVGTNDFMGGWAYVYDV